MASRRGERVAGWVVASVRAASRHRRAVVAGTLALTLVSLAYSATHLGVNADPQALLDADLPFQRLDRDFARHFPSLNNALLVVVDGDSGEQARRAATDLADTLRRRADRFTEVYVPGTGPFFEHNALLYRTVPELEDLTDHLAEVQPILAELSASPDLPTLSRVVSLGLESAASDPRGAAQLSGVLDQMSRAAMAVYAERPLFVSWEAALLSGTSFDPSHRAVIVAQPVLDFDRVLAAAPAIDAIRADSRALGLADRGVRVRITGYPALNYEEMRGLVFDVGISGVVAFAIVLALLFLALRSLALVIAAASTLLVGLALTAGFAALAVGSLNLVSIAFAVMFIGLGVDYSIHLLLHYVEERRRGRAHEAALDAAVAEVGEALLLCTFTTSIGFLSFMPTDYRGVGELGLISGVGMLVILTLSLTFLPALLGSLCRMRSAPPPRPESDLRRRVTRSLEGHAGTVAAAALLAGIASLLLAPRVRFDSNVVEMRNPNTESVQTFNDLLADGAASPWYIDVLEPSLDRAYQASRRLQELPEVDRVVTLRHYVPEEQETKREILGEAALILELPQPAPGRTEPTREQNLRALHQLSAALDVPWVQSSDAALAQSARELRRELTPLIDRLEHSANGTEALARFEQLLLGRLPQRLAQLRSLLEPQPVSLATLPRELRERMVAEDGSARIQVFPRDDMTDDRALARFVAAVRAIEPDATGLPVNIVEFGRETAASLREATLLALGAIALVLLALWRRPLEVALVLAPLALAGGITVSVMVLLDMPFNFANVIVLPLLLGIGVDSGIHLVERSRRHDLAKEGLADSTTARAILYSAFTTLISFSNLAFSGHRGISSLGVLLCIGMAATLVCTLLVLPALLTLRARAGAGR
jgi:uncharacterized protein